MTSYVFGCIVTGSSLVSILNFCQLFIQWKFYASKFWCSHSNYEWICWSIIGQNYFSNQKRKKGKHKTCFNGGGMVLENKFYVNDAYFLSFFRFHVVFSLSFLSCLLRSEQPIIFFILLLSLSATVHVDAHWGTNYLVWSF